MDDLARARSKAEVLAHSNDEMQFEMQQEQREAAAAVESEGEALREELTAAHSVEVGRQAGNRRDRTPCMEDVCTHRSIMSRN